MHQKSTDKPLLSFLMGCLSGWEKGYSAKAFEKADETRFG
jgi:hypothetical protein